MRNIINKEFSDAFEETDELGKALSERYIAGERHIPGEADLQDILYEGLLDSVPPEEVPLHKLIC